MPKIKPEQTLTLIQREDIERLKQIGAFHKIKTKPKIITLLCERELERIKNFNN